MKKMRFIAKNVRLQVIPAGTGYLTKAKKNSLNFRAYVVSPGDRASFLDLLKLQDGAGVELEFNELDKADMPKVGDKATVDGKAAKGDYTMPDGSVIVCENGTIKKIIDPEGKEVDTFNI